MLRRARRHKLSRELEDELAGPPWVYPWTLRNGRQAPLMGAELASVHATREALFEAPVRAVLAAAGPEASALDLACNEGWFSHRLLQWGASRVVAVDVREQNIRRAALLREHFEIPAERLDLRQADVFELEPEALGNFDVVLLLGLIYHVENPMEVIRLAHSCSRELCVIESQLTRQSAPIEHGQGRTAELHEAEGSFAIVIEQDEEPILSTLASTGNVLSLVPNKVAFDQMARVAGFNRREFARPGNAHNAQYQRGDRAVLLAYHH